jgi:hypothetical protein
LGLIGWVLVIVLLVSSVPAAAANASALAKGAALSAGKRQSLLTVPGVEKTVKGKRVTYSIPSALVVGKRLTLGAPKADTVLPTSISMAPMESAMGQIPDYNKYSAQQPVLVDLKPANAGGFTYELTISDENVLDAAVMDGVLCLVSQDTGRATVTIETENGLRASKAFTVREKVLFSSMAVDAILDYDTLEATPVKSKMTLYPGDSPTLLARPRPYTATYYDTPYYAYEYYATSAVSYKSSNPKVAAVSTFGSLYALKPGKTTITVTARDGSKKKKSFKLTVKPYNPDGLTLSDYKLSLAPGNTHQLKGTITPEGYYDQKIRWVSSNPKVAKVDANGKVTAVSAGKTGAAYAVIVATTNTGKLTASCTVYVTYDKAATGTTYRFYGVGNGDYGADNVNLPSCINDLNLVADAMEDAGLTPGDVHRHPDETGDGIRGMLNEMAGNATIDANDVTIFYYSGHGKDDPSQTYRGALCGTDVLDTTDGLVPVSEVQSYLDRVPGTVVVIVDSCLSGQFITAKSASPAKRAAAAKAYNGAWVSALSRSKATNFTAKALTGSAVKGKYKILTACQPLELSWGGADADGFGWFTYWLGIGLGRVPQQEGGGSERGVMEADLNGNNLVSLQELYKYVSVNVAMGWDPVSIQHTQVWPANDSFPVVNRFGV